MNRPVRDKSMTAPRGAALSADFIRAPDDWRALRVAWDVLHRSDPDSGIYLDWRWLDGIAAAHPDAWRVLRVRGDDGRPAGFLPLAARLHWSRSRARLETRLDAAGRLDLSDQTGIVCAPGREAAVIAAMAAALARAPVARLSMRYEPTGRRAEALAAGLAAHGFTIDRPDYIINGGTTDQLVCPVVPLPESFDAYVAGLDSRMRKRLRRAERQRDGAEIHLGGAADHAGIRDGLLAFWAAKWRGDMGADKLRALEGRYRDMIDRAQAMGVLYMPSLWQGGRMLGASAYILDHPRRRAHAIVEGRTPGPDGPDTGMLLMAGAIRGSIEAGFTAFDLGHGNAPYKYRLGARDERTAYFTARRETDGFDPAMTGLALARIAGMIRRGETDVARKALAQVRAIA